VKGQCQLLVGEHRPKVLWVNTGIVTTPLFWVNVPMAHEHVGFGAKFPGAEMNDHVELGKVFQAMRTLVIEKYLQVPMSVTTSIEVLAPSRSWRQRLKAL